MLDIGILSYNSPEKLYQSISLVRQHTTGEFRVLVVDNNSSEPGTRDVITEHAKQDERIIPCFLSTNSGYAGGINTILRWAENHYVAYVENDCYVQTPGWNDLLIEVMERHHELGMIFPGTYVSYPIPRDDYAEILWGTGCMWLLNTARIGDVGYFDETIGHQEEVDYQQRMHLKGWKVGALNQVQIHHDANATSNPASKERINAGVVNWMNKWNEYYHGPHINYYSPNVTRFEDWEALYLEEWYKLQPELQGLNDNPETVFVNALGREVDLIKVPRYRYLYRGRII